MRRRRRPREEAAAVVFSCRDSSSASVLEYVFVFGLAAVRLPQ